MKKPFNVFSVIFIGPAHSGKSSCHRYCAEHLTQHLPNNIKIKLFPAQEAATEIFQQNPGIDNQSLHFQLKVLSKQVEIIETALAFAEANPDTLVIILQDRSTWDGCIYLPSEKQKAIHWDYFENLADFYVFFEFSSACISNNQAGNIHRKESLFELVELAEKTKSFYFGSSSIDPTKLSLIPSFPDLRDKQIYTFDKVKSLIEDKIATL